MQDIYGVEIKVGMRVKTKQPSGGIFAPAKAETGIVEKTQDAFGYETLCIRYRKEGKNFDGFIILEGKINEVVKD